MDEDELYRRLDLSGLKTKDQKAESRIISEAVFDRETLVNLYTLTKKDYLTEMVGIVATGKEANLYLAKKGRKHVAIKIYLQETSDFRNMTRYIRGDPRFTSWKNHRQLIHMWAQKEFKNLNKVCDSIACPEPFAVEGNVLVMEFLGKAGEPAPKLKESAPKNPQKYYDAVIGYMRKMYELRLVHADLSEYNILDWKGKPYLIDFSAGVLLDHPESNVFLERDLNNVVNYFAKIGAKTDYPAALKKVTGES